MFSFPVLRQILIGGEGRCYMCIIHIPSEWTSPQFRSARTHRGGVVGVSYGKWTSLWHCWWVCVAWPYWLFAPGWRAREINGMNNWLTEHDRQIRSDSHATLSAVQITGQHYGTTGSWRRCSVLGLQWLWFGLVIMSFMANYGFASYIYAARPDVIHTHTADSVLLFVSDFPLWMRLVGQTMIMSVLKILCKGTRRGSTYII